MSDAVPPKVKPHHKPAQPSPLQPSSVRRQVIPRSTSVGDAGFPVVAIGASASGLEACTLLLDALPAGTGMAFILVQHLEPTHESLLVRLLAEHVALTVVQAADGMPLAPEYLYVIPPGSYLTVSGGVLRLSPPDVARGARLPFDALLRSLALEHGAYTACVVLSGMGADGSNGLQAFKEAGGVILVQDPAEAGSDGMPRSAIATGLADTVASAAAIPAALTAALAGRAATLAAPPPPAGATPLGSMDAAGPDPMSDVIALLLAQTGQDFTPHKRGTLERRVERRMTMAGVGEGGFRRYLDRLRADPGELDLLARDLLIHVTSFFRDPHAYAALAEQVIPSLLAGRAPDQPVRIWVAGCSTGEEAYSLAMPVPRGSRQGAGGGRRRGQGVARHQAAGVRLRP